MTDLSREGRRALETFVKAARQEAEAAAADALRRLGVADAEAPAHLDAAKRAQRNRLRAHARALGDGLAANGAQAIARLTEQAAYVQWHRLLFARFLVERKLLREEWGAAVSLTDCREIALGEGAGADEWTTASGFAAKMLPGVFPADDPVEGLVLAPEHARTLRTRLLGLDAVIFQTDDSLGWTYQFWRAAEKKAVNEAQVKIGAAELPAVTQLFTEPYMVRFLLHNSLGAWWAGKVLAKSPELARDATDEAALRTACALPGYSWDFLRFVQEDGAWRPAAGTFPGWPAEAKALTVLDPCCGSGHFLVEALGALAALRRAEEGLSPPEAIAAVLRDNLAGLEIDGRCVQIAAFNLALAGWRIAGPGAALPTPNVAWVGAPRPMPKREFAALANGDADLARGLEALHDLFANAPLLGSLIEPRGGDLVDSRRIARVETLIEALVQKMRGAEPERAEGVLAARGMADAAAILAKRWVLQATNVPFLGRGRQDDGLKLYLGTVFPQAKADLATAMLQRMRGLAAPGGTVAAVTPQNWLFLGSYKKLRETLLVEASLAVVAVLGEHGFDSSAAAGAFTALAVVTEVRPGAATRFAGLDANDGADPAAKAEVLLDGELRVLGQAGQRGNPDARITVATTVDAPTLSRYAESYQGIKTGDDEQFRRNIWEQEIRKGVWRYFQSTVEDTMVFGGTESALRWNEDGSHLARRQGLGAFRRVGVGVSQMRHLPVTIHTGAAFDSNISPIIPKDPDHLAAIWAFCSSSAYADAVRKIDRKVAVANATVVKVPFDLAHWQPGLFNAAAASGVSPWRNRVFEKGGSGREAGFPAARKSDSWDGNRGGGCRDRVCAVALPAGGSARPTPRGGQALPIAACAAVLHPGDRQRRQLVSQRHHLHRRAPPPPEPGLRPDLAACTGAHLDPQHPAGPRQRRSGGRLPPPCRPVADGLRQAGRGQPGDRRQDAARQLRPVPRPHRRPAARRLRHRHRAGAGAQRHRREVERDPGRSGAARRARPGRPADHAGRPALSKKHSRPPLMPGST
jgi:hypothetical protein